MESQRGATLQVAGNVGHYQGRIRDTTRKMMALVSELSMQQVSQLRHSFDLINKFKEGRN